MGHLYPQLDKPCTDCAQIEGRNMLHLFSPIVLQLSNLLSFGVADIICTHAATKCVLEIQRTLHCAILSFTTRQEFLPLAKSSQ